MCVCTQTPTYIRVSFCHSTPVALRICTVCVILFVFPHTIFFPHLHLTTPFVFTEFTEFPQFRRNRMPPIRRLTFALLVRRPELDFDPCKYFTFNLPFFFLLCLPFLFALLVRRPELDLDPCKYVLHNKFTVFFSYGKLSRALTFENLCQNTKSGTSYAFFQCVYC